MIYSGTQHSPGGEFQLTSALPRKVLENYLQTSSSGAHIPPSIAACLENPHHDPMTCQLVRETDLSLLRVVDPFLLVLVGLWARLEVGMEMLWVEPQGYWRVLCRERVYGCRARGFEVGSERATGGISGGNCSQYVSWRSGLI